MEKQMQWNLVLTMSPRKEESALDKPASFQLGLWDCGPCGNSSRTREETALPSGVWVSKLGCARL